MSPSSPVSAAADTPRRMTRALAKSLGTDSPAPSPSQRSPASVLRKKATAATAAAAAVAATDADREPSSGTIGTSSDDGLVVVEQPASPEVIVLDDSSDNEVEEVQQAALAAEPVEAELAVVSQAVPAAIDEDEDDEESDEEDEEVDEDDSSSTEGSSSDDDSSDEDDDEDDEPAAPALDDDALEALLSEAYLAADARAASKTAAAADGEVILQLDQQKDKPLPSLSVPDLPEAYFSIHMDGRVTRGPPVPAASGPVESTNAVASSSKLAAAPTTAATPELDTFALPAQLSKKAQKAARKANAPLGWAELPPIPDDRRKDMTREYHALRLRNALDPKRHYKGQGSSKTVPEVFAIGKLHEPAKVLASSTLTTAAAARPGSIVSDILADTSSRAYAKRKFGALQSQRERNGRKKTTKKPRH